MYNKKKYVQARKILEEVLITEGAGSVALGQARRFLGEIYYNGYGVKRDKKLAKSYFERARDTPGVDPVTKREALKALKSRKFGFFS